MGSINQFIKGVLNNYQSIALFFARLLVAYGFFEPAMNKWKDIESVGSWFGTLGIPMPLFSAYMSASVEILGVFLLTLGLLTRFISFPMMIIMVVAILTVHLPNGFESGNNGFEIPLYYLSFLLIFLTHGAGKISIDHLLENEEKSPH